MLNATWSTRTLALGCATLCLVGCGPASLQDRFADKAKEDPAAKVFTDAGAQFTVSDRPIKLPDAKGTVTLTVMVPSSDPMHDMAKWAPKRARVEAAVGALDADLEEVLGATGSGPVARSGTWDAGSVENNGRVLALGHYPHAGHTQVEVLLGATQPASPSDVVAGVFPELMASLVDDKLTLDPAMGPLVYPDPNAKDLAVAAAPGGAPAKAMSPAELTAHGKDVFGANCASCHQLTGQGVPGTFPPLAGSEVPNGPAAAHIKTVLNGLQGAITVKGQSFNGVMPPWKQLSDEDIAAVVTYERTNFGNHGGAVTPDQVKALR